MGGTTGAAVAMKGGGGGGMGKFIGSIGTLTTGPFEAGGVK